MFTGVEGKRPILILRLGIVLWFATLPGFTKPVVVEFFTSDYFPNSVYARDALLQLSREYSTDDLHLLVYDLTQVSEKVDAAFFRAVKYGIDVKKQLPAVVFNGTTEVFGAKDSVYYTYRDSIENFRKLNPPADLNGWMQLKSGGLTVSASYVISVTSEAPVSASDVELFFILVEDRPASLPGWVQTVVSDFAGDQGYSGAAQKYVPITVSVNETNANGFWLVQDKQSNSILLSIRAPVYKTVQFDLNGDHRLDKIDLFVWQWFWSALNPMTDLNQDGIIDQRDLLLFLGSNMIR